MNASWADPGVIERGADSVDTAQNAGHLPEAYQMPLRFPDSNFEQEERRPSGLRAHSLWQGGKLSQAPNRDRYAYQWCREQTQERYKENYASDPRP